jgi:hypothetical protein
VFFKKSKPLEKSSEICLKYSLEIWNQHKICDFWTYADQFEKKIFALREDDWYFLDTKKRNSQSKNWK